jgi:hypothetical protein
VITHVELLGPTCSGIYQWDVGSHALWIDDVLVKNTDSSPCTDVIGVVLSRPLHARALAMDLRAEEWSHVTGISMSGDVRMTDSDIQVLGGSWYAFGISAHDGVVLRSTIVARGSDPMAVSGDHMDVLNCELTVETLDEGSGYTSAVWVSDGAVAHNVLRASGPRAAAARVTSTTLVGNDIIAQGVEAAGVVRAVLPESHVELWSNRFDVDAGGCLISLGGQDACSTLEPCPLCAASDGNTLAPDAPAPQSAVDRGAPSTVALDLEGVCRDAVSPVGPRVAAE